MRLLLIIMLTVSCIVLVSIARKQDKALADAIDNGILTHKGKSYHVIPWEGTTP